MTSLLPPSTDRARATAARRLHACPKMTSDIDEHALAARPRASARVAWARSALTRVHAREARPRAVRVRAQRDHARPRARSAPTRATVTLASHAQSMDLW